MHTYITLHYIHTYIHTYIYVSIVGRLPTPIFSQNSFAKPRQFLSPRTLYDRRHLMVFHARRDATRREETRRDATRRVTSRDVTLLACAPDSRSESSRRKESPGREIGSRCPDGPGSPLPEEVRSRTARSPDAGKMLSTTGSTRSFPRRS